ncbi:PTS lactose/cellobiose transporter subunit IIA [Gracilibacillus suaedae]|uniref:PTS lactose/cellobiose transporter subunit IIA n=1 Tax=Gracilibacillus suaedae TaxID=2820273 RepID=UPI002F42A7B1
MSQNNTEALQEVAMQIILGAGNARADIQSALRHVETFEFVQAEEALTQAKKHMSKAHSAQTETIQKEARGENMVFSTLFTHAQDHLMTVMSEWNIARNLLRISQSFDQRIKKLEE